MRPLPRGRISALVCAVVVMDSLFFAALTPLLPYYAARFALTGTAAGVLSGAYAAGTLLGSLPVGWIAARVGPRATVVAGLALTSGAGLVFAFGDDLVPLVAARFLQGVGGACSWVGALGWLVSANPPTARGRVIGRVLGLGFAGALLGPAVGAVARRTGPEAPFAAIAGVAVLLLVVAVRTPQARVDARGREPRVAALRSPPVLLGLAVMGLPSFVAGSLGVLGPLRLDALGAGGLAIAVVFLAAGAAQAVGQVGAGRLVDRAGTEPPVLAAAAVGAVLVAALPLPGTVRAQAALLVGAIVAFGVMYTPATTLLVGAAEGAGMDQASALALVNLTWAGGQAAGAVAAGRVAEAGAQVAWSASCATVTVVAALVLWWCRPHGRRFLTRWKRSEA